MQTFLSSCDKMQQGAFILPIMHYYGCVFAMPCRCCTAKGALQLGGIFHALQVLHS